MRGADDILYMPTEALVEQSLGDVEVVERVRPNEQTAPRKRRRRRSRRHFEEPPELFELYGGYEAFLVRTAVIRAQDYDSRDAPTIQTPDAAWPLLSHLQYADQEHIVILALNTRMRLLAIHEAAVGGSSSAAVAKQHAVKVPLLVSATAVIMAHNHPSASRAFSPPDVTMTKEFKAALDCVGIALLDHILVTRNGPLSYMEAVGF